MYWYLSMNNRNLRHSEADFTEIRKRLKSFVFPLLSYCLDEQSFESINTQYNEICDEFDRRMK
jgi:hypothetical protein